MQLHTNDLGAMESGNHSKNGTNLKNHSSKESFYKIALTVAATFLHLPLLRATF
jgi:hypothetical protein